MNLPRRKFFTLLGGTAAAWPIAALAQQPAVPVIGYLSTGSPTSMSGARNLAALRQGLGEIGYIEGRNLSIEFRWANDQFDRLPGLAADLVRRRVGVLFATGSGNAILAAKSATTTIPIVFSTAGDPVEAGYVASLNRPGGNITGATSLTQEIGSKQIQLLHEVVPSAAVIALLVNPANPVIAVPSSREMQAAAARLGLKLPIVQASAAPELDAAFASLPKVGAGALVISADGLFGRRIEQLATLTVRHAVPAIAQAPEFAAAGGLISYGGSQAESYRIAGTYVGRILKGEKPADLPVQQSTKLAMAVNLKTAKALGLTVPLDLQVAADEVIE
jgi:putative ABC transport system substrate-binding protein